MKTWVCCEQIGRGAKRPGRGEPEVGQTDPLVYLVPEACDSITGLGGDIMFEPRSIVVDMRRSGSNAVSRRSMVNGAPPWEFLTRNWLIPSSHITKSATHQYI